MAEEKLSVRVDTNVIVDLETLEEAIKGVGEAVQKVGKQIETLNEKMSQISTEGIDKIVVACKELGKQIDAVKEQQASMSKTDVVSGFDNIVKVISGFNTMFTAVKNVAEIFSFLKEMGEKCFAAINNSSKTSSGLLPLFATSLQKTSGILSLFGEDSKKAGDNVSSTGEKTKKSSRILSAFGTGIKNAGNFLSSFGTKSKKTGDNVSATGGKIKKSSKILSAFKTGIKNAGGLLSSFGTKLKEIASKVPVFDLLKKGFAVMVESMKKGFENLAQYSDDYNGNMSALKGQVSQMGNSLAAAFEPIANAVIPYITQLVSWITTAADAMGQFLAAMQGKSTYTKAKQQMVDYAKSLDTASESARKSLAAFDELNVLSEEGSSSESGGGEATGADAFEVAEVDSQIASVAGNVQTSLQALKDSFSGWFDGLDFLPLLGSLEELKTACEPFLGGIFDGLLWFFENVLQPIGSWTIESALPAFFELLAEAMSVFDGVLASLQPVFDYVWNNILVPMGQFVGDTFIGAINLIKDAFSSFGDLFEEKSGKINEILMAVAQVVEFVWTCGIQPVIQRVMGMLGTLIEYVINIVGDVIDVFAGIVEFFTGIFTGDMEKAGEGLLNVFKGIGNFFINIIEGIVNVFIDGLNAIHFTVPDWVPLIGGTEVGFNLQRLTIPRLADGAVIQGGKPFAAILGDQKFGQTNIETPLQTMIDAFKIAMADSSVSAGGNYTFVAQLDGRTIFQETIKQSQMYQRSTGQSAFAY